LETHYSPHPDVQALRRTIHDLEAKAGRSQSSAFRGPRTSPGAVEIVRQDSRSQEQMDDIDRELAEKQQQERAVGVSGEARRGADS
jgi:hypothetical protein